MLGRLREISMSKKRESYSTGHFGLDTHVNYLAHMNIEEIREYCLAKPGVTEGFPFNDTALVFKVGKMFALLDLSEESRGLSLKCDPDRAIELRELHPEVTGAWHFNKTHWNGVALDGNISDKDLKDWIDHSYDIVRKSLSKKQKEELGFI